MENKDVKAYLEYHIGLAKFLGADEERARIQQSQALEFEILLEKVEKSCRSIQILQNGSSGLLTFFLDLSI